MLVSELLWQSGVMTTIIARQTNILGQNNRQVVSTLGAGSRLHHVVHIFSGGHSRNALKRELHSGYFFENFSLRTPRYDQVQASVTCLGSTFGLTNLYTSQGNRRRFLSSTKDVSREHLCFRWDLHISVTFPSSFTQAYTASATTGVCCGNFTLNFRLEHAE